MFENFEEHSGTEKLSSLYTGTERIHGLVIFKDEGAEKLKLEQMEDYTRLTMCCSDR